MADFVAVLRKTIGGLGDTSPEMREKVFDKARATIEAKLAAIEPPPPAAVIERQKQALEEAIAVVRAEFAAPAEPELDDALESVLAEFDKPAPSPSPAAASQAATGDRTPARETGRTDPVLDEIPASAPAADPAADNLHAPARERLAGDTAGSRRDAPAAKGGKRRGGLIAAVLALVVIAAAAGGYVWWSGDRPAAPPPVAEAPAVPELSETETAADEPAEAEEATPVEEAAAPEPAPPAPAPHEDVVSYPEVSEILQRGGYLISVPLIEKDTAVVRANVTFERGVLQAIDETARQRGITRSAFLASAARKEIERS